MTTTRRGRPPGPAKAAVTIRLTAEARAVLDSLPGGPSAAVERLLLATKAVTPTKSAAWVEAYASDQRLLRQEIMAEPPRTHEDFACASCGKPVPIGDWPIVHEPRRSWSTGYPCCSAACVAALSFAGLVRAYGINEHDRQWMRRRLATDVACDKAAIGTIADKATS